MANKSLEDLELLLKNKPFPELSPTSPTTLKSPFISSSSSLDSSIKKLSEYLSTKLEAATEFPSPTPSFHPENRDPSAAARAERKSEMSSSLSHTPDLRPPSTFSTKVSTPNPPGVSVISESTSTPAETERDAESSPASYSLLTATSPAGDSPTTNSSQQISQTLVTTN